MGRIKTMRIKSQTAALFKDNADKVQKDFESNKQLMSEITVVRSKKIRNIIAGYLTRLAKAQD